MREIRFSEIARNAENKPKELGREIKCGSAVLTALQIKQFGIDEIAQKVVRRRVHAFLKGADLNEWMNVFWHNVGIVIAAEIAQKFKNKADR